MKESNQIKGTDILGQAYPYTVIITTRGIDKVENMFKQFLQYLKECDNERLRLEHKTLVAMGICSGISSDILKEIKRIIYQYPKEFTNFITSLTS